MSTETAIREIIAAYGAGDLDKVRDCMSDDVHYRINSTPGLARYTADCRGKDAFFEVIHTMLKNWDPQYFRLVELLVAGNRGAARCDLHFINRADGSDHFDHLALFFTVEDGKICAIHEFHDTGKIAAAATV